MYAIIEQNFKAITSFSILLLMGLALLTGQSSALGKTAGPPESAENTVRPVLEIAIDVNIRQNGE